jgi:hypothetical protein
MSKDKWWEDIKIPENVSEFIYYTAHPPRVETSIEELNKHPAHIKANKEDLTSDETIKLLFERYVEYKGSKDPKSALEAFVIAHEGGMYPPVWVLDFMSEVFNDWIQLDGEKRLDDLFELNSYQGGTPLYKARKIEKRDQDVCQDVFILNTLFTYSIEGACQMAARRLEETEEWGEPPFVLNAISADTIKDKYHHKWKNIFKAMYASGSISFPDLDTKEARISYLKQFPEDSFPPKKSLTEYIQKE